MASYRWFVRPSRPSAFDHTSLSVGNTPRSALTRSIAFPDTSLALRLTVLSPVFGKPIIARQSAMSPNVRHQLMRTTLEPAVESTYRHLRSDVIRLTSAPYGTTLLEEIASIPPVQRFLVSVLMAALAQRVTAVPDLTAASHLKSAIVVLCQTSLLVVLSFAVSIFGSGRR